MTPDVVVDVAQQSLFVLIRVGMPVLLAVLAVGLVVGMFQAATQINEMTLSFIPKILVLVLTLFAAGPWMLSTLIDFTRRLITSIPSLIG